MINVTKIESSLSSYGVYSCLACGNNLIKGFIIRLYHGHHAYTVAFCFECFQELQAKTSPLAILVQTGVDTK